MAQAEKQEQGTLDEKDAAETITQTTAPAPARSPIVRAKICIPTINADYLSRPRLNEALNSCIAHRLTLVIAPAGYGKTSFISFWAHHFKNPPAWLSLSETDAPSGRFWRYFSHALDNRPTPKSSDGQCGKPGEKNALPAYHQIFEDIDPLADRVPLCLIDSLLAAIEESGEEVVCVLDDFHRIDESAATLETIGYFIGNCPANFHLVITSRSTPPLKLAKMRATGELLEIPQETLTFTKREVSAGLAAMQIHASDAFAEKVFDATLGWPVGIKLISLSLDKKHAPVFDDSLSFALTEMTTDYLFEEVVERMPPDARDFVLSLSIVENFCPSLASAIMQSTNETYQANQTRETLRYLKESNLFIIEAKRPDGEPWYSLHALFRNALQRHARLNDTPNAREHHRAASAWFAQHGFFDYAVSHAACAKDYDAIRDIIIGQWTQIWENDQLSTLTNWFDNLPEDYVSKYPKLCLFSVEALSVTGRFQEAERRLEQAKRASRSKDDFFEAAIAVVSCIHRAVKGDEAGAYEAAQEALAKLPPSEKHLRAMVAQILGSSLIDEDILAMRATYQNIVANPESTDCALVACSAYGNLAQIEALVGNADDAFSYALKTYEIRKPQPYVPMFNVAFAAEAIASYLQGKLPQTNRACQRYFENIDHNYTARNASQAYCIRALIAWREQDDEQAAMLLEEAVKAHPAGVPDLFPSASFLSQFSHTPALLELLDAFEEKQREGTALPIPQQYFVFCLRLVAFQENKADDIAQLLESIDEEYRLAKVQTNILLCLSMENEGSTAAAEKACSEALSAAEPQTLVQPFVDAPQQVKRVVKRLARANAASWANTVNKTLALAERNNEAALTSGGRPLLSERELEVMNLAACGMATKEIAATLFISHETVKKHLGNVYAKLGTHNRAHAVSLLKEQNLL